MLPLAHQFPALARLSFYSKKKNNKQKEPEEELRAFLPRLWLQTALIRQVWLGGFALSEILFFFLVCGFGSRDRAARPRIIAQRKRASSSDNNSRTKVAATRIEKVERKKQRKRGGVSKTNPPPPHRKKPNNKRKKSFTVYAQRWTIAVLTLVPNRRFLFPLLHLWFCF